MAQRDKRISAIKQEQETMRQKQADIKELRYKSIIARIKAQ